MHKLNFKLKRIDTAPYIYFDERRRTAIYGFTVTADYPGYPEVQSIGTEIVSLKLIKRSQYLQLLQVVFQ